jgi:hypothetical protein
MREGEIRMYEKDMEEKGKDREGERWGIGIKKVIFPIVILCLVMFIHIQNVPDLVPQRKKEKSTKKDK